MTGFTADQLSRARKYGTATLHEAAGRIGALPSAFRPINQNFKLAGPAFTVHGPPHDNLWIHRALYAAARGDIIVAATNHGIESGYWGEILNTAAIQCGLGGLVLEGGVRDTMAVGAAAFPVFSCGICIRGTGKDFGATGWLNAPIRIGDVTIRPGDLIVGDADGVLALPADSVAAALEGSAAREADEADKLSKIRGGARTIDLYGLGAGEGVPRRSKKK